MLDLPLIVRAYLHSADSADAAVSGEDSGSVLGAELLAFVDQDRLTQAASPRP